MFVDVGVGCRVDVALVVGEGNTVGLALGVGGGVGVEEVTAAASELGLTEGAAARLGDGGAVQLAALSPITMTSRQTISHS
jgi:hypothetical protein